jgi:hypothetical protein
MGNAKENEQGANMGRICEEIWLVRTTSLNWWKQWKRCLQRREAAFTGIMVICCY